MPLGDLGLPSEVGSETHGFVVAGSSTRFPEHISWAVHGADKELFLILAREAVPPFKVDSTGSSPLDAHISRLAMNPRITQFLLPLPKGQASANASKAEAVDADIPEAKAKAKTKAKAKRRNRQLKSVPKGIFSVSYSYGQG